MNLREKQSLFVRLVAQLIEYAYAQGYSFSFGECWRPPEVAQMYAQKGKGIANSLHTDRLAIDLNLFKGDQWVSDGNDPAWLVLAKYWESLHPLARAGVRFGDANHFSLEHSGRK